MDMKTLKLSASLALIAVLSGFAAGCGSVKSADESDTVITEISSLADDYSYDSELPDDFGITFSKGTDIGCRTRVSGDETEISFEGSITEDTEYILSGNLNGNIFVDVDRSNSHTFTLVLSGAVIQSTEKPPLMCLSAECLIIRSDVGTENYLYDGREKKDGSDTQSSVYSLTDITICGGGRLWIKSENNNGVHSKSDLEVRESDIFISCADNALKGNDSAYIRSGKITLAALEGDGIKTSNSGISKNNVQEGNITISSESDTEISIFAARDGIDAAYGVLIEDNGFDLSLNIQTDRYSDTSSLPDIKLKNAAVSAGGFRLWGGGWGWFDGNTDKGTESTKGIKAHELIKITGGVIDIRSYDDCIHSGAGTDLENGEKSSGGILISGGVISLYTNDDAIHADGTLTVAGGDIVIESCYEGLEANHIAVFDGNIRINAKDDGLNVASSVYETPDITVSGGYINITMGSGDVDGIDSNGSYTQTGGIVISRGAPGSSSPMASGLDVDRSAEITGGTLILIGGIESAPSKGEGVCQLNYGSSGRGGFGRRGGGGQPSASISLDAGEWSVDGIGVSIELTSRYKACTVFSDLLTAGETYTLSCGGTSYSAEAVS